MESNIILCFYSESKFAFTSIILGPTFKSLRKKKETEVSF